MSLNDDLDSINMRQTKDYKDEAVSSDIQKEIKDINEKIAQDDSSSSEPKGENPFGKRFKSSKESNFNVKKLALISTIVVLVGAVGLYFGNMLYGYITQDRGTDWMQEVEGEGTESFKYDLTERELLRNNGYNADDIERYEVEERDPYILVEEAKEARRLINEAEVKPYLDGASDEYKSLASMTWLGGSPISEEVLKGNEFDFEVTYGTFNCDYDKVPPRGSQLFLRLYLEEYKQYVFMSVNSKRYVELKDSGNIVINMDYNIYPDGSIIITNVEEKDIQ